MFISFSRRSRSDEIAKLLAGHFGSAAMESISISERQFPSRIQPDLQRAVEALLSTSPHLRRFLSVKQSLGMGGLSFATLMTANPHQPVEIAPPEYVEVDVGDDHPVRCLKVGLWLLQDGEQKYAVLMSPAMQFHQATGISFQVAVMNGEAGVKTIESIFKAIESAVQAGRSYRGKILSLEQANQFTGLSTAIKVHKLRTVAREQVVLPQKTLALLERNIIQFVQRREKLLAVGQATRKGVLFYGPPGTGKSHTIHYLAGALKGHTMLLISAEQVGLLDEYMSLARLLQPSVVVIEDVDLIARDRTTMNSTCEEVLLNKLLNEMDGLKESADILFILTTNRPEALEAALASRPGRVDQAIEFPFPDEQGREKLIRLYGGNISMTDELVHWIASRTEKVSAAFIKELMRRTVQFQLERENASSIDPQDVDNALDEMLFSGGSLNAKLLGGNAGLRTSQVTN